MQHRLQVLSQTMSRGLLPGTFTGKLTVLRDACLKLGGYSPRVSLSYDLAMQFDALPKVPILLLFNDLDSEFPAQSSVLFENGMRSVQMTWMSVESCWRV